MTDERPNPLSPTRHTPLQRIPLLFTPKRKVDLGRFWTVVFMCTSLREMIRQGAWYWMEDPLSQLILGNILVVWRYGPMLLNRFSQMGLVLLGGFGLYALMTGRRAPIRAEWWLCVASLALAATGTSIAVANLLWKALIWRVLVALMTSYGLEVAAVGLLLLLLTWAEPANQRTVDWVKVLGERSTGVLEYSPPADEDRGLGIWRWVLLAACLLVITGANAVWILTASTSVNFHWNLYSTAELTLAVAGLAVVLPGKRNWVRWRRWLVGGIALAAAVTMIVHEAYWTFFRLSGPEPLGLKRSVLEVGQVMFHTLSAMTMTWGLVLLSNVFWGAKPDPSPAS